MIKRAGGLTGRCVEEEIAEDTLRAGFSTRATFAVPDIAFDASLAYLRIPAGARRRNAAIFE